MDALSKQAPVFGEDTDVIYFPSCNLNTQFDFTVMYLLQVLRLNVVFGHFLFVSKLICYGLTGEFWISLTA